MNYEEYIIIPERTPLFRQLTLLTCLDSTEVASLLYSMICDTVIFKVYFCSILIYEEVCDIQ